MARQVKKRGKNQKIDNSDIPKLVKELNRKQLEEIAQDWIKEQRNLNREHKIQQDLSFLNFGDQNHYQELKIISKTIN